VAAANPCFLTACLPIEMKQHGLADDAAPVILELAEQSSILAIGPGIGQNGKILEILEILLVQTNVPMLLDAFIRRIRRWLFGWVIRYGSSPSQACMSKRR
jgi:NAD(P)H-hydrate repair Nnr-like enzyme with NAD(P)H-hydrate dehydratase domain